MWRVSASFPCVGTGKTLSIICSALQWIVDRRQRAKVEQKIGATKTGCCDEEEPDWMRDFVVDSETIHQVQTKGRKLGTVHNTRPSPRKYRNVQRAEEVSSDNAVEIDEAEFLVDEFESDEDDMPGTGKFKTKRERGSGWNSSEEEDEASEIIEEDVEVTPKIYFCSRTHSQLSQFVGEFKKTKFASELNAICLGSRKNLCINEGAASD